MLVQVMSY